MSDVEFVGVKPAEVEFLRVERPQTKKRPPSPREARAPSPREERPQTKKRPPSPREARYPTAEERAEFERARAEARAELRAKDEAKDNARKAKAKARAPAPREANASDEASANFNVGDLVFHKDFSYCKVVGFTLKRIKIKEKNGRDHVVSAASLHVQSHNAANTAQIPALRRLRDFKEEDERLSDAYLDGLRYNPAQPWPQGRDPPSPQTRRSAIK
jgi:hypothetical protein